MPYFGWARQDRKDRPAKAIGALNWWPNMLEGRRCRPRDDDGPACRPDSGIFRCPGRRPYASGIKIPRYRYHRRGSSLIAAPRHGGAKRANTYSKPGRARRIIISHKERAKANVVGK